MPERQSIPAVTAAQMASVDRIMTGELGLDVLQLMELAGRAVAVFARDRFLDGDARGRRVVVLAGTGGNGGDGMVAARLLHAWGAEAEVWLAREAAAHHGIAEHQRRSLAAIGLTVVTPHPEPHLPPADLLIDALLGFSLTGAPTGATADLIRAANAHDAPVLAVDLPSGLDATAGAIADPTVRATATLTLALPKTGLLDAAARSVVGELHVADIGVPSEVYARLGLQIEPLFGAQEIIRIV